LPGMGFLSWKINTSVAGRKKKSGYNRRLACELLNICG
jgi:hypothetical protein